MEQRLDSFRPSTSGWLVGTLAGWGTILLGLAGFVAAILTMTRLDGKPLIVTAIAALVVLAKWARNMAARYELTPERLIIHRGILMKSIDEIELFRVKDCRVDFSLISQLADIGTITLTSSDETTRSAPLVLPDIKAARTRRERLRQLVDAARQRRHVREIDTVQEPM